MKQGSKVSNFLKSPSMISVFSAILAVLVGLTLGFLMLLSINAEYAVPEMIDMLTAGFSTSEKLAKVFYQAAPLIMTGLSVGFAFKTGLFNIGASGQFLVGGCAALVFAVYFQCPWWVCMLVAMVAGAIWGIFPGLCKALFNVNEVITSIMFNWIGLYAANLTIANVPMMLASHWGDAQTDRTPALAKANLDAIIPTAGLDEVMGSTYMNISIFIAIAFAAIVYIILQKTTFGYELKACGLSRQAAVYAGINDKKNIILSMVIAGALAGVGGGIYYLAGTTQFTIAAVLPDMGFNGIPVALLASSHPIGTIFSALFISYIQVGGEAMQPKFQPETIDIIIAVIIYLAAFSLLMRGLILKAISRKKAEQAQLSDKKEGEDA